LRLKEATMTNENRDKCDACGREEAIYCNTCANRDSKEYEARITELEKQIEEAGKDTKRLDWLDEYSDMILCPTGYGENTWMVTSHNDKDADGKTIREAIDKAMD
jgi:hypothetical protein